MGATTPPPPRVSVAEWWLVCCVVVLGIASAFSASYDYLVGVLWLILPLNAALLTIAVRDAVQERYVGKALLVGSTFVFFWLDAAVLASAKIPFSPNSVAIGAAQFSEATVGRSYFHIALFELTLFLGYSWSPSIRGLLKWTGSRIDARAARSTICPCAMAAVILLPLLLQSRFDPSALLSSLLKSRSQGGTAIGYEANSYISNMLYYIGMYGTALLYVRIAVSTRYRWRCAALAAICTVPVVLTGARHLVLYILLPVLAVTAARPRQVSGGRPYVRLFVLALGLIVIAQVQLILRPVGFDKLSAVAPSRLLQTDISGQFSALLLAEHLVPSAHDYFLEPVEPYFVTHFVPRGLWSTKPEMRTQRFYDDSYTQGVKGTNYTPTAVGQYYMNWGFLGVAAIGCWLGFLGKTADRLFARICPSKQMAIATGLGMFYAFLVSSFRIYAPYYFAFFGVGFAVSFIISRRSKGSPASPSKLQLASSPVRREP